MKRLGRVRECDAKYLTGRPSFTGASWGDTLNLKSGISSIGIAVTEDTTASFDAGLGKPLRGSKSASARLGLQEKYDEVDAYGAAKGIYSSATTPLLSHIWPSISQKRFSIKVERSKSAGHGAKKEMQGIAISRKMSDHDMYGANGSEFRSSSMGTGYDKHVAAEISNLPANMRRQYEKDLEKKRSRHAKSETKKSKWNASPHCVAPVDVKLKDSPFKKITYEEFHVKTKTKGQKQVKDSYKTRPFKIVMPKQVQWEQNKKVAKKKWGSVKLKQSIAGRLRSLNLSLHAGAVSIPGALGGLDEGDEDAEDTNAGISLPVLVATV